MSSDLHDYINSVLKTGNHGPYRALKFEISDLNDILERHSKEIAHHILGSVHKFSVLHKTHLFGNVTTVHNDLGNISFQCTVEEPKNLKELVDVMVKAKKEKKNVRAVGAFHAWSPVCVTAGYLVKTDSLVGIQPSSTATLKDPSNASAYYDVLCGTSWKEVVVALEKKGRAVMNLPGYSGLRVVGSTATGTHGSGLTVPPLAGMIRGVTLVSAKFGSDGNPIIYRIEPTGGITNPNRHSGPVVLLQDDKTFNAVIVGLCAFGVVYSVTIETLPFYWVVETRQSTDWSTAKGLLEQGPSGSILECHNAEVWFNPYTKKALITRREVTTTPPKNGEDISESVFTTLIKLLPALKMVLGNLEKIFQNIGDDVVQELGQILAGILKEFPLIIPNVDNIALDTQDHAKPKTGKYYDIYDIGFANQLPAISNEISYPMSTYIAAVDSAMDWFDTVFRKDFSKSLALAGFISIRFTSGIAANLSMSYSPDPATSPGRSHLEIFSLFALYNSIKDFDELVGPFQEKSINQFKGRLHWGQYVTPSFTALQYKEHDSEFFESISEFKKIAEKFDPERIMWNEFMNQTIWSVV